MEMLFVFSSTWWWLSTIAFIVILFWGGILEEGWMLGLDYVAYILLMQFVVGIPLLQSMYHNPGISLVYVAIYLLIGTFWSIFKWFQHVNSYVNKSLKSKEEYLKDNNVESYREMKGSTLDDWNYLLREIESNKPRAKDEKSDLSYWIAYWPISMIVFFFEDFLKNLISRIVDMFGGVYRSIENRLYKKLD